MTEQLPQQKPVRIRKSSYIATRPQLPPKPKPKPKTEPKPKLKKRYWTLGTILPSRVYSTLSPEARRVYQVLWNRIHVYETIKTWMSDKHLCGLSYTSPDRLEAVISELIEAELLEVTPGSPQSGYRVLPPYAPILTSNKSEIKLIAS